MDKKYQAERYSPLHGTHIGHVKLKFDGKCLTMQAGYKLFKYPAVSGWRSNKGFFCYCKGVQKRKDHGPIPEGEYWIQIKDLWKRGWGHSLIDLVTPYSIAESWGDYRISIHPFPNTNTYTRGGFFIHGGATPGSIGCIDLTLNMNQFITDLTREMAGASADSHIHLSVNYGFVIKCPDCAENDNSGKARLTYYIREAILEGTVAGAFIQIMAVSGGGSGRTDANYSKNLTPEQPYYNNPMYTGVARSQTEGIRGGPIPAYQYFIKKPENNRANLIPTKDLKNAVPPNIFNKETGRNGGFQIHGRGIHGSDGCIVPLEPAEFHRLMEGLTKDNGGILTVVDSASGAEIGPKQSKLNM